MRTLLLLLTLYLAQADPLCPASQTSCIPPLVKLSLLPIRHNNNYQYSITNYANTV